MKVALVHNPDAGDGRLGAARLRHLFAREGHRVFDFGKTENDVRAAIESGPDLLAVAGGDGTVGRAVTVSFAEKSAAPIAILPVGTANNIARTLDVTQPIEEVIRSLVAARPARLDVGRVSGPWGEQLFVEAAGVGFIGTMLRNPLSRARIIASRIRGMLWRISLDERKARGLARLIRQQPARGVTLRADGRDLSGQYIGIEAMNIREIGPNVRLAASADPSDGQLDLALIRAQDRAAMADAVERRATAIEPPPHQVIRARRIELTWEPGYGHVDDEGWPDDDATGMAEISIAGAVTLLRDG